MSAAELKDQGNKAFQEGKFEEAAKFYSQAIDVSPNDHILYSNRSGSYGSIGRYQEALDDAEKCIKLNPNFVKGYQRKGFALHHLGKYEEAVQTYKQGLTLDPSYKLLSDGLAAAEHAIHERDHNPFAEALKNPNIQRLLSILQRDPRTAPFAADPTFMQLIGLMISNPQMATQFMQTDPRIQTALQVILENPEAQKIFFSEFAGKVKKPADAQGEQQHHESPPENKGAKMEEEHPEPPQPKQHQQPPQPPQRPPQQAPPEPSKPLEEWEKEKNLGNEEYKNKNFPRALEHYNKALQLQPEEPLLYNNKAAVYIETKDYDLALAACDEGLKLLEEHKNFQKKAKLLARKAKVFSLKDELDTAIDLYQQSLIEDGVQSVKDEMKRLQKIKRDREDLQYINPEIAEKENTEAGELFRQGKFPDAILKYTEAVKRNPKEPKYYCNRATAYMKVMEFARAVQDLEKCLSLDNKYVKAYIKKANCHFVMKEFHKSKTEYENGLKIEPGNEEMKQGLEKVNLSILAGSGSEEEQKQRATRAMQDPEIQQILREPEIINLLNDMQTDPKNGMRALQKNPDMAKKIEKLIAAGVLKMG